MKDGHFLQRLHPRSGSAYNREHRQDRWPRFMKEEVSRPTRLHIYGESAEGTYSGDDFRSSVLPPYAIGNSLQVRTGSRRGPGYLSRRLGLNDACSLPINPARILPAAGGGGRHGGTLLHRDKHGQLANGCTRRHAICRNSSRWRSTRAVSFTGMGWCTTTGTGIPSWDGISNACCR